MTEILRVTKDAAKDSAEFVITMWVAIAAGPVLLPVIADVASDELGWDTVLAISVPLTGTVMWYWWLAGRYPLLEAVGILSTFLFVGVAAALANAAGFRGF